MWWCSLSWVGRLRVVLLLSCVVRWWCGVVCAAVFPVFVLLYFPYIVLLLLASSCLFRPFRVLCHSIVGLALCFSVRVVLLWNSGGGLCVVGVVCAVFTSVLLSLLAFLSCLVLSLCWCSG